MQGENGLTHAFKAYQEFREKGYSLPNDVAAVPSEGTITYVPVENPQVKAFMAIAYGEPQVYLFEGGETDMRSLTDIPDIFHPSSQVQGATPEGTLDTPILDGQQQESRLLTRHNATGGSLALAAGLHTTVAPLEQPEEYIAALGPYA